ncbi:MAG: peptide chain release factor N(5)-glutamine methyltransferase [Candidatus Omnitrophica bacterium]|nr:peptide chain release factor N(5)-glutamine methyltransferase [Candidatus Omnitrophota bacterium]
MKLNDWLYKNNKVFCLSDLYFLLKIFLKEKNISKIADNYFLNKNQIQQLENIRNLYKQGMPIAYIVGEEEFYGERFFVNKDVLIPRPSTEILVEEVLKIIDRSLPKIILDLGCGCLNIAISIAKNTATNIFIVGSDISYPALLVSKKNIKKHNVNIKLVCSDMLLAFKKESFDIIVSNPPYVEEEYLKRNKYLYFEPRLALAAGEDGLYFIFKIIKEGYNYLKKGGHLVIEVGALQRKKIDKFGEISLYRENYWVKDYSNVDRVLVLKK